MPTENTAKDQRRHLVLIDIENEAATASPTTEEVERVISALRDAIPDFDQALCIVACSHHAARTVAFAFPRARHLWRSGPDGAELALLDVMKYERVDQLYGRVTICSGDGIFAASAAWLAGNGIDVTVVSLEGHLASRLELAAGSVVFLAPAVSSASTKECQLMAETAPDLISMADIARLAGQSRATVGNWKSRNPDFPAAHSRGRRGPLYDRAEVISWLVSTGRLNKPLVDQRAEEDALTSNLFALERLVDLMKEGMRQEDAVALILLLLAAKVRPDGLDWQRLLEAAPADLDGVLQGIVLSSDYSMTGANMLNGEVPAAAVAGLIEALSHLARPSVTLVADALLEHPVTSAHSSRGLNMLPPSSLRRLMVAIAEPAGSIYDPASGLGQLLIDAALYKNSTAIRFVGEETGYLFSLIAMLILEIHGLQADLAWDDVLEEDHFPEERADRVIAAPPWNTRVPVADRMSRDPRWVWGEPGPHDGNAAWMQHCLYHLADGGRAVLVLPNAVLFEAGRAGRIRQRIIKAGLLDAVFALPPRLFAGTDQPCSMLVFAKGRPQTDGKPPATLMVDLSGATEGNESRPAALGDDLIDKVAEQYRRWLAGGEPAADFASVARFDDLGSNDFIIDPRRYFALPSAPHQDVGVAVRMRSTFLEQLEGLIEECDETDELIKGDVAEVAPDTFEAVRLGDLSSALTIAKGFPTQRAEHTGEIPVMSVAALRNRTSPRYFADRDALRELGIEPAQPGDVLVAIEGGTLGESLVMSGDEDEFVPSQQAATLRIIDPTRLDPWYLGAWLMTEPARERMRRLARGSANQRVPIKDLASLTVMVPALADQRSIGRRFLAFQNAIQSHRSVTACLEQLRRLELVIALGDARIASSEHAPAKRRKLAAPGR